MTQRKSIGAKLFIALIALTLISCCFLGSTFARYTSGGNGSASTGVAEWNINGLGADEITVTFDEGLSPSMSSFESSLGADVSNSTDPKLIATITNEGDVAASITISFGNLVLTYQSGSFDSIQDKPSSVKTEEQVKGLFDIALYYGSGDSWTDGYLSNGITSGVAIDDTLGAGDSISIYAVVTWTTKYSASDDGVDMDELDTFAGENVATVSWDVSYTAVQASEIPAGN